MCVRDHRPLQQGLRRIDEEPTHLRCLRTRPSSTTTRIKTQCQEGTSCTNEGTRPSSTTTRIKTRLQCKMGALYHVRDHRPLQQGLRLLVTKPLSLYLRMVRDHRPLQQGLRLPFYNKFGINKTKYETIFHYNKD